MKKRIISIVLAILMIVSILPVSAFAETAMKYKITFLQAPESLTIHPGEDVTLTAAASAGGDYLYYLWFDPDMIDVNMFIDMADKCVDSKKGTVSASTVVFRYGTKLLKYYNDNPELEYAILDGELTPNEPSTTLTMTNVTESRRIQCLAFTCNEDNLEEYDDPNLSPADLMSMASGMTFSGYQLTDIITITVDPNAPCHNHKLGDASETKHPDCVNAGESTAVCSRCGNTVVTEIPALGHSYENGICKNCGEVQVTALTASTTSAGKPLLKWTAVEGATGYIIYRSTDGVNYTELKTVTSTSFTNTTVKIGTTYSYKVVTLVGDKTSADSNVVSVKCIPATPTVTISRVSGKAKLSWKKVDGATKYNIYRSTDGKTFKLLTSTTNTSYTNSNAASGTKYYYKVKAVAVVNGTSVYSAYSTVKSLLTTLATPTVKITTASGKPSISWSKVTGADKYYIYRSTDGKTFKYYTATTKTKYTNTNASKNKKYYYKVKAVSTVTSSANSALSKAVSIKATK